MDKEELIKRAQDPKYISGIYNYCDRWCERCQFTSRCLNHSLEEEQNHKLEDIDQANERFWESIKDSFKLAFNLIEDLAQEQGIDLAKIEFEKDEEIDNRLDMLTHRARNYANMVDDWFKNNQNLIENELIKQSKQSHLQLLQPHTTESPISLQEVLEVISYYKYAITVKFSRAIRSRDIDILSR